MPGPSGAAASTASASSTTPTSGRSRRRARAGVQLLAARGNVSLAIGAFPAADRSAQQVFEDEQARLADVILGFTAEPDPFLALPGLPNIGYRVGHGGAFAGTVNSPQGPHGQRQRRDPHRRRRADDACSSASSTTSQLRPPAFSLAEFHPQHVPLERPGELMPTRWRRLAALLATLAVVVSACASATDAARGTDRAAGTRRRRRRPVPLPGDLQPGADPARSASVGPTARRSCPSAVGAHSAGTHRDRLLAAPAPARPGGRRRVPRRPLRPEVAELPPLPDRRRVRGAVRAVRRARRGGRSLGARPRPRRRRALRPADGGPCSGPLPTTVNRVFGITLVDEHDPRDRRDVRHARPAAGRPRRDRGGRGGDRRPRRPARRLLRDRAVRLHSGVGAADRARPGRPRRGLRHRAPLRGRRLRRGPVPRDRVVRHLRPRATSPRSRSSSASSTRRRSSGSRSAPRSRSRGTARAR